MFLKAIAGLMIYTLAITQVIAQTATLVPNAKQTFLGTTGAPLAAGTVTMYVPNSTTKKTTWLDAYQASANTNPVVLDAAGRGIIFGQGNYRQVVKDKNGVPIWDSFTSAVGSSVPSGATGTDTAPVGTVIPFSGFSVPVNWQLAYGQAINRTTFSDLKTAITIVDTTVSCINGSSTLTGFVSTSQMRVGSPIEATCFSTGVTIVSIVSPTSITISSNASSSGTVTSTVFPWGNGDGTSTFNVPDLRGRVPVGPDGMGGTPALRLQTSTNLTTTSGSPTATVVSATNISNGMVIINSNVAVGTTILSISGTTITLSANATGTGTASARFSALNDANTPAGSGGTQNSAIAQMNLPNVTLATTIAAGQGAHVHTFNQSDQAPNTTNPGGYSLGQGNFYINSGPTTALHPGSIAQGVLPQMSGTTPTGGANVPYSLVQPSLSVNYIIKVKANTTGAGGVVSLNGMFGDIICDSTFLCAPVSDINTIGLAYQTTNTMLANVSGIDGQSVGTTLTQFLDASCGNAQGSIVTRDGSSWVCLTPGAASSALVSNGPGNNLSWSTVAGLGTVVSVGLSLPNIFNVTNSPVTLNGTLTGTLANQNANIVFAGPSSGAASPPSFRALAASDISSIAVNSLNSLNGSLNITAGTGISISTPGAGAIQIDATGVTGVSSFNSRTGSVVPVSGDYTEVQITPTAIYNVKYASYGAKGDWQQASDGAITASNCSFSSSGSHFTSGDVGKGIQIGGAGAAGALLTTTIASFSSGTSITLTACASTTVGPTATYEWYTNDSSSINSAIAAAKGNGYVLFPCGNYATSGVNATQWTGGKIIGAGGGYGCSTLHPIGTINAIVDFTGSPSHEFRNMSVGSAVDLGRAAAGVVAAPSSTVPGIDTVRWDHVFVSGHFTGAACYRDRIASSAFVNTQCWNYQQSSVASGALYTNRNYNGVSSAFTTTLTNATIMNITDLSMFQEESHGIIASGASTNFAILIDGAMILRWFGGNVDSSNSSSMIWVQNGGSGTVPDYLTFTGTEFYSENGTTATNIFGGGASLMSNIYMTNIWKQAAFTTCANSGGCARGAVLP